MSACNVLTAASSCPKCKNEYDFRIQFKFADTWQFEYFIGDRLKWGGNDEGVPDLAKVIAYGIAEDGSCPVCGGVNHGDEFDILIEHDIIKAVCPMVTYDVYWENEGCYHVVEK